jgi:putative ABC transport system permease protein
MHLVARAAGDPAALLGTVRGELRALDRSLPLDRASTLAELVSASAEDRRIPTLLLGLFAAVTLALSALGVYGVTSYAVARRTGEIGIRGALGADRLDIVRLVLAQGMRSALLGIAAGLAGSLALTRFLASLLYGVSPTDLAVFTAVALLLGATAALASFLPARRAAKLAPSLALRCE